MKYLRQFGLILLVSFAAECVRAVVPAPIPASVYGLVMLFCCLKFRWIKLESIAETGSWLLELMPLMFVPPAVALVDSWRKLNGVWTPAILLIFVGTAFVLLATAETARLTSKITTIVQKRRNRR